MTNLESLVADDLRVEVSTGDADTIRCTWSGKSAHRHPGRLLGPWFEQLIETAGREERAIAMHFEQLKHFNSSTIGAIVQLIQSARARDVRLRLVYSGDHRWQRLSFEALKVFDEGDGLFTLETV